MAQLDKFLAAVVQNNARALRVEAGAAAVLQINGTDRPVTRAPLTNEQIATLVVEAKEVGA